MTQASGSYSPTTFTLCDAPEIPQQILRLTLRQKSVFEKVMEKAKGLSPENLLSFLNSEKARILEQMKERGHLTQDECDFINKANEDHLRNIMETFIKQTSEQMAVTPNDSPEEVEFKLNFGEQLIKWLKDLFNWVVEKMKTIFQWLKEAFQWCLQKAKELFEKLWSFFS